jgi:hypothetical protein
MRFVETTLPANADIGRAAWFEEGFRHGETDAGGVARDEGVFLDVHARPAVRAAGYPTD